MTEPAIGLSGRLALGRYRVVRELARGGMGMVYLGRIEGAAGFSKPVVIKRVLSHVDENEGARAQFIREARLLSELHHPNIVGVLDFGEEDDGYLMILEYVHGFHVGQWLRYAQLQGRMFHWEFAILIVARVLSALQYAHNRIGQDGKKSPIIHRDVSPGNVLIDLQGNVRLLDFGIARAADDEEARTQNGVVKGKLPYIAPEIYRSAEASVVSDVYSTGVMLYQLLSGKNPFSAKDMSAIIGRVLEHQPAPLSTLREDLPPGIDAVVRRALEKDPTRRYQSAQEFSTDLMDLLTCSEAIVADQLRASVAVEFSDEMADVLGVASLSALDSAWRAAADDPDEAESLQRSSMPPADTHTAVTQEVPVSGAVPHTMHELETLVAPLTTRVHADKMKVQPASPSSTNNAAVAREPSTQPEAFLDSAAHATEFTTGTAAAGQSGSRSVLAIVAGAAVLGAAVLGAALLLREGKPVDADKPQRFLLVERPATNANPTPTSEPSSTEGAASSPSEKSEPSQTTEAVAKSDAPPKPSPGPAATSAMVSDADRVTAAFGRRQGAVQSCFSNSASGISGTPQLSVRFKIGASGAVESATINPSSVAGTSLGSCLLSVARGTKFPALGKSLAFSIPITAQVVKN